MAVTAAMVKELRQRTGLGMMECKKALVETDGDIETAIDNMRKSGQAKAAKKASRTAAEGALVIAGTENGKKALLLEVNSETDFAAREENFVGFARRVAKCALNNNETDMANLAALEIVSGEGTVEDARLALVQKIGENIQIRRAVLLESAGGVVGSYVHGGKIGVLVEFKGGDEELGKDVAMHIAAVNPLVVSSDQVPEELLAREKDIFSAQARDSGKPEEIIEKMIAGRVKKYLKEVSLLEQPFVKDPDTTVGKLVNSQGAEVLSFIRFELGEGIEKDEVDFAAEVMAQAKSN